VAVKTRDDLSMAYTPACARLHGHPRRSEKVYNLTIKQHTVAVVTDGSAVLGLGDIGPAAGCPSWKASASSSRLRGSGRVPIAWPPRT